jgi:hypothetical protein
MSANDIQSKAMLVRLTTKKLNRNTRDKILSAEMVDRVKASEAGALRVQKSLFSKQATKAYEQLLNEARKYYYRVTLPWDYRGFQLLPVAMYKDFTDKMKSYTSQYRELVNEFIDSVEVHISEAKDMLGEAFNIEDYNFVHTDGTVDRTALMECFDLSIEYSVIPDTNDIRVTLTDEDKQALAEEIESKSQQKFAESQKHIITLLYDHICAIHERLSVDEHVFRDSLIGNLEQLCDLIPKLNISNDPTINNLAREAKAKIASWDPGALREDNVARKEVAKAADEIMGKMQGIV